MYSQVDVAIAGAGPAGAVAALVLARAGVKVQLFDRAVFPRKKLCGDTVNPGAVAILQRLELSDRLRPLCFLLGGMLVTGLYGVAVKGRYKGNGKSCQGWSITRHELDAGLVKAAVDAGAKFDEKIKVRGPIIDEGTDGVRVGGLIIDSQNGQPLQVRARVTIAADGRRSVLGSSLGLTQLTKKPRRWAVGSYFSGVDSLSDLGEMHIRCNHYVGVSPVPGGLANVCVVSSVRDRFAHPEALVREVIASDSSLRDRFAKAQLVGPVTLLGPMAMDVSSVGVPGLLLAGDAAGFVDPITGDGIRFALRGGELAARAALMTLATGNLESHRHLASWRVSEFGYKYKFNRAIRLLVSAKLGVTAGSLGAAMVPAVLRRAINYAGDIYVN